MYAVARLSSYISRGVYTVSGPFHPFGGAVDIIVVQQPDGSFKSSPWYVKFGKFQGVLKTREKIVKIDVNGVEPDFHMYLDHKGEAYFLSEAVGEEELVELIYSPPSSGDETDEQQQQQSRIGNSNGGSKNGGFDDVNGKISVQEIDMGIGKIVTRTNSRRSRIFGLVFGRNSFKEGSGRGGVERVSSLESAEIAADLLDVKWSTNLSTDDGIGTHNASKLSDLNTQAGDFEMESLHIDEKTFDHLVLHEATAAYDEELGEVSELGFTNTQCLDEVTTIVEFDSSKTDDKDIEVSNLEASDVYPTRAGLGNAGVHVTEEGSMSDSVLPDVHNLNLAELGVKSCLHSDIEPGCKESNGVLGAGLHEEEDCSQYNAGDLISEVNFRPENGALVTNTNINDLGLLNDENFCEFLSTDATSTGNETCVNSNQKSSKMESDVGYIATEVSNSSSLLSESVAEDQFFFDDIDQIESSGYHSKESIIRNNMDTENHPLASMVENEQESNDKNYESSVSSDKLVQECPDVTSAVLREESITKSNPLSIPRIQNVPAEICLMAESLPNIRSHIDNLEIPDVLHPLSCSVDSSSKSLRWPLLGKEGSISLKLDSDSDQDFLKEHPTIGDTWNSKEPAPPFISRVASFDYDHNLEPEGMIAVNKVNQILDVSSDIVAPGGSWRWPFSFRKSGTMGSVHPPGMDDIKISGTENTSESTTYVSKDKNMHKDNIVRKKVKSIVPTSEQLASLNLKEGQNVITFTFSTAMLGKQQVDARIYLWKWNARVVVSDVDGTITKSDVLGQFMPLVGKDWSQTGVAHLFSAIEENGYQLLFLSARAISQAYLTRQFLVSLKQDGKALPDGPVVISPDGLFPSLFREVIRRAPHEFKIACLEDIKALFPPDCNPFYAGFGNRDTDEISYVKVGIPKGKIFIINPKGQVAVNRRVDLKSYTSIHALVNGMFPAMSSVGKEEFNSWNYWKMPYPEIDI